MKRRQITVVLTQNERSSKTTYVSGINKDRLLKFWRGVYGNVARIEVQEGDTLDYSKPVEQYPTAKYQEV